MKSTSRNHQEYYVLVGGQQKGPFQLSQMQSMWRNGAITGKTQYWREGLSEWATCSSIASLLGPPSKKATKGEDASPETVESAQPKLFSRFTKIFIGVVGVPFLLILVAAMIQSIRENGSIWVPKESEPTYVQREMDKISVQVAVDAERQYEIAKRSGSAIDAYTSASLVVAAYLQAKDEANYQKWKRIEAEEAKRAGISIPQ